jgi:hypothetical protein
MEGMVLETRVRLAVKAEEMEGVGMAKKVLQEVVNLKQLPTKDRPHQRKYHREG